MRVHVPQPRQERLAARVDDARPPPGRTCRAIRSNRLDPIPAHHHGFVVQETCVRGIEDTRVPEDDRAAGMFGDQARQRGVALLLHRVLHGRELVADGFPPLPDYAVPRSSDEGEIAAVLAEPEVVGRETETRSEEHTSELQSLAYLVCRLLLEKKK